jgi:hypothetical protein
LHNAKDFLFESLKKWRTSEFAVGYALGVEFVIITSSY